MPDLSIERTLTTYEDENGEQHTHESYWFQVTRDELQQLAEGKVPLHVQSFAQEALAPGFDWVKVGK